MPRGCIRFSSKLFSPFSAGPTRNHVRPQVGQSVSDPELGRHQMKQMSGSVVSLSGDDSKKHPERDGVASSARGLLLPSVQNMKQNVSEKVAQVRPKPVCPVLLSVYRCANTSVSVVLTTVISFNRIFISCKHMSVCLSYFI